jgi:hypothetical protein
MRCRVNVFVTQTMIQETWLPSRCLAMGGRSDSDIPAFSGTPQYIYTVYIYIYIYIYIYVWPWSFAMQMEDKNLHRKEYCSSICKGKIRPIPIEVDQETVKRKRRLPQLQNIWACYKYNVSGHYPSSCKYFKPTFRRQNPVSETLCFEM